MTIRLSVSAGPGSGIILTEPEECLGVQEQRPSMYSLMSSRGRRTRQPSKTRPSGSYRPCGVRGTSGLWSLSIAFIPHMPAVYLRITPDAKLTGRWRCRWHNTDITGSSGSRDGVLVSNSIRAMNCWSSSASWGRAAGRVGLGPVCRVYSGSVTQSTTWSSGPPCTPL